MSRHRLRLFFPDRTRAARRIRVGIDLGRAGIHEAYFEADSVELKASGDALFCLGLPAAMQLGWDLDVEADVDPELLANAGAIQRFYTDWYSDFRPIAISAGAASSRAGRSDRTGVFFSGGVDSFYSALAERDRLDALVTILGADVNVDNVEGCRHLTRLAQAAAAAWSKQAIVISTDLRAVFNGLIGWEEFHGAALAAIRHLLADHIGTQFVASTAGQTSWNRGWGSHPGLDPLFGTSAATIVHHGLVGRADKILALTSEPVALENLKVCFKRHDGTNCGGCQKCAYAIEAFDLFDALDRAITFPFRPGATALVCTGGGNEGDLLNLLDHCKKRGKRPDLQANLVGAVQDYRRNKRRHGAALRVKRGVKRLRRKVRLEVLARLKSHSLPTG
jgi:hypothetical protein